MLLDTFNIEHAALGGVVGKNTFLIDIFPPPFKVYQSNSIIEDAFDFLYLTHLTIEIFYCLLHHPL